MESPEESSPHSSGQSPGLIENIIRRANSDGRSLPLSINITNYQCPSPSIGNNYQGSTFNGNLESTAAQPDTSPQVHSRQNSKAQPTIPAGVLAFLFYLFAGLAIRLAGTDVRAQLSTATNFMCAERADGNALDSVEPGESVRGIKKPHEETSPAM
ncbi:hypothetical protein AAF712_008810 [Marasmius tenuissimus]|uniref:Uncharacterized protein n=1 Tax=Marasmius tenuissimus TaxID=585030 RepID=A0ABR2ZV95_9AGAR